MERPPVYVTATLPDQDRRYADENDPPMTTLAIAAIARDAAPYIEEWIAFHAIAGVSTIRLYDNSSTDGMAEVARRMSRAVNIEVINYPSNGLDFSLVQRGAYKDAKEALRGKADFVAFIDIDEFLYDTHFVGLPDALGAFSQDVGAIAIPQIIFGSSGEQEYRPDLVIKRFRHTKPSDDPEHCWFKTIARPECIRSIDSVHSVTLLAGEYVYPDTSRLERSGPHPGQGDRVVRGRIGLHHYILKSLGEFREKHERMRAIGQEGMAERYHDSAFFKRDSIANLEKNDVLLRVAAEVEAVIAHCRV